MNRVRVIDGKRVYEPDPAVKAVKATQPSGPGTLVKAVLDRLNIHATADCGCAEFQRKMDEWKWSGCLLHWREIVAWFSAKATEQNITVTPRLILRKMADELDHQADVTARSTDKPALNPRGGRPHAQTPG